MHVCNKHKIIKTKEFNHRTQFINIITLKGSDSKKLILKIDYDSRPHFQKHHIVYTARR